MALTVESVFTTHSWRLSGRLQDSTFYNNSTSQDISHGKSFGFRIRININKDIVRSIGRFRTLLHFSVFIAKRHSAWP